MQGRVGAKFPPYAWLPCGPFDPRACVRLVERRSPWIDDVSCAWAASPPLVWLPNGPYWPLGLLVLGLGIYALDNMLVTCSFGPNAPAHILRPESVEFIK